MENRPLRQQIRRTFIGIIVWSVAATLVTLGLGVLLFIYSLSSRMVRSADYYEQQLPELRTYIRAHESEIPNPGFRAELERRIPSAGMRYQVLQRDGRIRYGSLKENVIDGPAALLRKINTTLRSNHTYMEVIPLSDGEDNLTGAVLLAYRLRPSAANAGGQIWLILLFGFLLLAPFAYILLFTRLFSRRLTRRINRPLTLLREAADKIMVRDLDFTIDYQADNELGDLCRAFAKMKEELVRTLAEQWRMEQERTEMVAALAHDLKAPLSVIASYTEALQAKQQGAGRTARYLGVIWDNVAKCSALVKKMQYSAELDAQEVTEPQTEPSAGSARDPATVIALKEYLERKVLTCQMQGSKKQLRIESELVLSADDTLAVSPERLDRILDNILSNGLEYTPPGGSLKVTAVRKDERLYITVSDSGPGFTHQALEQATHRFYRGDAARQKDGSHAGLGLYITQQLITKLGGKLNLSNSEESGGAQVSFWLPWPASSSEA